MSRLQQIYDENAGGRVFCDIQQHMPTLRQHAHGNVFEIGVRAGCSTAALLLGVKEHGGHVWSVDIAQCGALYADDADWTFIHGHSMTDSARILGILPRPLDVLFIDGEHDYKSVSDELHTYGPLVKAGGVILLHDADLEGAGVRRALDEYGAQIGSAPSYVPGSYGLGVLIP